MECLNWLILLPRLVTLVIPPFPFELPFRPPKRPEAHPTVGFALFPEMEMKRMSTKNSDFVVRLNSHWDLYRICIFSWNHNVIIEYSSYLYFGCFLFTTSYWNKYILKTNVNKKLTFRGPFELPFRPPKRPEAHPTVGFALFPEK